MGLTEELHDAVGDPPPLGFDLDQLMQDHRPRRVPSRAALGIAGFAAVAMVLAGGYALNGGGSSPTPFQPAAAPTSPAPRSTAPSTSDLLDRALPGLPSTMRIPSDGSVYFRFHKGDSQTLDYYNAHWLAGPISGFINITSEPIPHGNACAPGNKGELGCQRIVDKYGVTYVTTDATSHKDATIIGVDAFRPDGTHVMINIEAKGGHLLPWSLRADLIAAAHDTGLSLHP
jgi:hypothetical protein